MHFVRPFPARHPVGMAVLALFSLLSSPFASAQTTAPEAPLAPQATPADSDRPALPRVEVTAATATPLDQRPSSASRLGLSLRETPASVSLIDREAIEAMGALNTQDVLKAVPGVTFSSQPGSPGSVFYRGFGASSLAQLYNGITVQYDAIAARPVDAWLVERLEAMGGPSSFLHGSGAVGGSLNVITKVADLQGELTQLRAALGVERQLAASLQRGSARGVADGQVLRLDLNATRGTHAAMGEGRQTWQAAGSWRVGLPAGLAHTLAVERQHERVTQPYWGTPLLRDGNNAVLGRIAIDPRTREVNYNVLDGKYQQDVTWARSMLEWKAGSALHALHTLYHYDALRDYENVETYTFVNQNRQVQRSNALLQRHDQQVWGSRAELTKRTQMAGLSSDFAVGWDWSYNRQTRFPLSVAGPFDTTDPYAPAASHFYATPGVVPGLVPGSTNQLRTFALFIENRTVLAPSWALTSALRSDRIALTVTNHRTPSATNPALYQTAFRPLTGRLGLVKDWNPNWQSYVQWSTAADPPSGLLATAGYSALRDFELTRGRQVEVGSKASFDDRRGEFTVALYDIVRKNLSMTDPADRTRVIPIGAQSSRGLELSARWRPLPTLQVAGHLSQVDAQYDQFVETVGSTTVSRAGNRPSNVPDRVAGVSTTWTPMPRLSLGVDWRYVGQRFANTANTVHDGAYSLFGLSAAFDPSPQLTLRARVDNAGNRLYAATVGTNLAVLGAPRTVRLSADWRF